MARRLLIVTHPYPPMPSVGGNRWLAMSKYLRRAGNEVTMLTTSAFGSLPDDAERDVRRAPDLIASAWLRRALRRPALVPAGGGVQVEKPPSRLITGVVVPDHLAVTWVPFAIREARRIVNEREIECLITTSAYESAHLVGLALRRRVPWIADFRDGWTFEPWKPEFPTGVQRRLDGWLERRVVQGADRVVVVQRAVGEDFRRRHGVQPAYVPNGWDPELAADRERAQAPPTDPERLTLVHTGRLIGEWGRTPRPLLEAIARLRDREPAQANRIEVVFAGRLEESERELIADFSLNGIVRHVGEVSRAEAMALQRKADVLLLITARQTTWELPGKVFEYLGAGRPVLALAQGNEAARVVDELGLGWAVAPDDVAAIEEALRRALRGELADAYAPRNLDRFVYPAPAEALADAIERALAGVQPGRQHHGRRW